MTAPQDRWALAYCVTHAQAHRDDKNPACVWKPLIRPVYVDGPLAGQDRPVAEGTWEVDSHWPMMLAPAGGLPGTTLGGEQVRYRIRKLGFGWGGETVLFWVASIVPDPPVRALLGYLFTDAARAAIVREEPDAS